MTRGLFFSFFLRMTIALAFVALMRVWFSPKGWILGAVLVLLWAALNAFLLSRSVRRSIAPLEAATSAIAEKPVGQLTPDFTDFDGLARSISLASKHVERVLNSTAESRRELEAMIDSMQDAVVAVDQAGRIQWTNQLMEKLIPVNYTGRAIRVGHSLVQTIRDPEVLECVRVALEERTVSERRSTSLLPGRIFEVAASPMPGGGAVVVLHDITRIEQVERTQREFVANVSHELRTPLTSITGYVETLLDHESGLSPQAREFLTTIHKNATRMNRLTEDLLVMARVESSEQELHPAPIAADTLVRDAVQAMRGLVQDEEAVLEIGPTTKCEVFADQDSIVQVLSNLIENGIKYGKSTGMGRSRVVVSAREVAAPENAVEFSVKDFGQGIASEHLGRIFERFYRVDKARSRESGGTGLGLAIAKHVVQVQGGSIRAESELNAGSTFLFTLPKVQVAGI
ncbi:sensor histidine kinase [Edaphobacter flagellatus]|uniref:sensor histidine kinase n=1 Tax=Edaphobacter flagellatus TaxID=1933044 RepID=UPI0021B1DA31|nr:ATP-binding protein [Edaphobacter flagellatus]